MAYGGLNKYMDAAAELGRNPVSKHQIHPEYGEEQADGGTGLPKPSRETKFSGTNADRGMFIFPVQLTTRRIGNLTRFDPYQYSAYKCDGHIVAFEFPLEGKSGVEKFGDQARRSRT